MIKPLFNYELSINHYESTVSATVSNQVVVQDHRYASSQRHRRFRGASGVSHDPRGGDRCQPTGTPGGDFPEVVRFSATIATIA